MLSNLQLKIIFSVLKKSCKNEYNCPSNILVLNKYTSDIQTFERKTQQKFVSCQNKLLASFTETVRKYLDEGKLACGIFVDLQKAFDTVEHDILLTELEHCGLGELANDWFKYYLSDRKQFVSINGHDSNLASVMYGVPQGSVFGALLFLISINDLNQAIKFYKVHHFADDTNLLHFSTSITKLNK